MKKLLLFFIISTIVTTHAETNTVTLKNNAATPVSVDLLMQDNKAFQTHIDIPGNGGEATVTSPFCVGRALFYKAAPKITMKETTTKSGQKIQMPTEEFYEHVTTKMGANQIQVTTLRLLREDKPYSQIVFASIVDIPTSSKCVERFIINNDYSVSWIGGQGKKAPTPLTKGSRPTATNVGGNVMEDFAGTVEDIFTPH